MPYRPTTFRKKPREFKDFMIIATAGHIDHGKTELIKAITGIDTDRLPEEKNRGISIDLGFAYCTLPNGKILGFVDVPGHEKFIKNMLAGVAGIDLGLLVVAVDDGVMQQTREHLIIFDLLGIDKCIVALTKIDQASDKRLTEVQKQVEDLFKESSRSDCAIYPVCAPKNVGVQTLIEALGRYANTTYYRIKDNYFRMAIDRVFSLRGVGLIVTGMVFSGTVFVSEKLTLSSNGSSIRVRKIRSNNLDSIKTSAGDRCALNVTGHGVSKHNIKRGCWLTHPELYVPTNRLDVELHVLNTENRSLKHWTQTHLYIGSDNIPARVAILSGGSIAAGNNGFAQIIIPRTILAVHGDRFVLRDQSTRRTVAGGTVLDPYAPLRGRAQPDRIAILNAMRGDKTKEILKSLAELSATGVSISKFSVTHNLSKKQIDSVIRSLSLLRLGDTPNDCVFTEKRLGELFDRIITSARAFHTLQPTFSGFTIKNIQSSLNMVFQKIMLQEVLKILVSDKKLIARGGRYQLPGHNIFVSRKDRELLTRAAKILAPDFKPPPTLNEAAETLGIQPQVLEKTLKIGAKLGHFVVIDKNRYLPYKLVEKFKDIARQLASQSTDGLFTTIEFRNKVALGRNFVILLLEYFDQIGFTVRTGSSRQIESHVVDSKSIENK